MIQIRTTFISFSNTATVVLCIQSSQGKKVCPCPKNKLVIISARLCVVWHTFILLGLLTEISSQTISCSHMPRANVKSPTLVSRKYL